MRVNKLNITFLSPFTCYIKKRVVRSYQNEMHFVCTMRRLGLVCIEFLIFRVFFLFFIIAIFFFYYLKNMHIFSGVIGCVTRIRLIFYYVKIILFLLKSQNGDVWLYIFFFFIVHMSRYNNFVLA